MTKLEGAIISAYTGIMVGSFKDLHKYVESILERSVFTHEFACETTGKEIKEASKEDFLQLNRDIA